MMRLLLLLAIFLLKFTCVEVNAGLFDMFQLKDHNEYKRQDLKHRTNSEEMKIVFISQAQLYIDDVKNFQIPLFEGFESFSPYFNKFIHEPFFQVLDKQAQKIIIKDLVSQPDFKSKIVYKHSQLLLQEAIREIHDSLKLEPLDMVLFTGNNVYSNDQFDYFIDIESDLDKFSVSYYEALGPNELRGSTNISKYIDDRFYLLKAKNTNFIVLDNVSEEVIPSAIPEEANEQYLWLKKVLTRLDAEERNNDLIVVSFKALDDKVIRLLNHFKNLKLEYVINSEHGELNLKKNEDTSFLHASKPEIIDLPSLSWYPCAYLVMKRDEYGNYSFTEKQVALEAIQDLARDQLH